mgnify:FL=1
MADSTGTIFGNQSKSYLEGLLRKAINDYVAFSYEKIKLSNGGISYLTIPDGAKYAELIIESDGSGDVARYLNTFQSTIDLTHGIPLSNGSTFDISMTENLTNFQIVGITGDLTYLHVQYYK